MRLVVLAKEPLPGRAKTRLCPPLSPGEASSLAEAALSDTLEAVVRTPAAQKLLVLEGEPGDWLPVGVSLMRQRGRGLDERLANAFDDAGGPSLLIGMDTPQLTPGILLDAMALLSSPGTDAVLGAAHDGGWWAIGLRRPDPRVFLGVPTSNPSTCATQRRRLDALGLRWLPLAELRDVDRFDDALAVAEAVPRSRFANALRRLCQREPVAAGRVAR
ncbi:MAG: TIGR04282 family arsenosugar biosynthesis glycosyltransferase [Actinomycetota bacterium]